MTDPTKQHGESLLFTIHNILDDKVTDLNEMTFKVGMIVYRCA